MTRRDAESIFRSEILSSIKRTEKERGGIDYPMRCEAWCNFTDSLCKEGEITEHQNDTWGHPRCNYTPEEWREKKLAPIRHIMES